MMMSLLGESRNYGLILAAMMKALTGYGASSSTRFNVNKKPRCRHDAPGVGGTEGEYSV